MVRIHEGSPLLDMYGRLAQLVERYPYKVDVTSSSLVATTIFNTMFFSMTLSSSGQGYCVFIAKTEVQIL
jgi:hypothetical protein